jgi:hypothetical protein
MRVTLSEWLELAALAKKAAEALTALEDRLVDLSWEHHQAGHNAESVLLRGLADEVANTELHTGQMQPQSEWMGGPSTGKDSLPTFLREPHCVGPTGRHFTQEEVEEAKQKGLLKGQYGGPIGVSR